MLLDGVVCLFVVLWVMFFFARLRAGALALTFVALAFSLPTDAQDQVGATPQPVVDQSPPSEITPDPNFGRPAGAIPVLTWGGLRGGISVALALSLPAMEFKPLLLTCTYAVVLFSIIIQGLTVKSVVNRTVDPTLV